MNTCIKNLSLLAVLITGLGLPLAAPMSAQTLKTLHVFTGGSDGGTPDDRLVLSGNTLYGTARAGGGGVSDGVVFAVNTDGTGFTNLYDFTGPSDGAYPRAGLALSGGTFYGTACAGGDKGDGTVFAINSGGTDFRKLYDFTGGSDGGDPIAGLILSGNRLYGTTDGVGSGAGASGSVFAVNTDGTAYATLHSFTDVSGPYQTNSDGANPRGGLVLRGNTLYGTTQAGGSAGAGAVFALKTDGTGFTNLHSFAPVVGTPTGPPITNSDGVVPVGALVLSGNTLYGVANQGGPNGSGAIFALHTDGTSFTNLHFFSPAGDGTLPNSDGGYPSSGLILSGGTLYGTANVGGTNARGTVFALSTNATGFRVLYTFSAAFGANSTNREGAFPVGALMLSGNTLYGTTALGGSSGNGTVFSLSLPAPQLSIANSGTNVILAWPTNSAGFDYTGYALQSSPNLTATAWAAVSPSPIVVNGQLTVTHSIFGAQQFFRLRQ